MDKQAIIDFFDRYAPTWDAEMIRSDEIIGEILDDARVTAGADVLDVACGTGVLFPDYLARGAARVTGIDISPAMAEIARGKTAGLPIDVICGDVETHEFDRQFDCVVVYNAFPHFPRPAHLIRALSDLVKPGGTLTVAHGMSRAQLTHHHSGSASAVSIDLLEETELATIFSPWFDVTVCVSDARHYQVTGVRRAPAGG